MIIELLSNLVNNLLDSNLSNEDFVNLAKEAQERLGDGNIWTEDAIKEADDAGLDYQAYKKILNNLKRLKSSQNEDLQKNNGLLNLVLNIYKNEMIPVEKLIEDELIRILVSKYGSITKTVSTSQLMLLTEKNPDNIPEETTVTTSASFLYVETSEERNTKMKKTFAHILFEQNAKKEDILHFFKMLNRIAQQNPEIIKNYLNLSDMNGDSIIAILKNASINQSNKYGAIYDDVLGGFYELNKKLSIQAQGKL